MEWTIRKLAGTSLAPRDIGAFGSPPDQDARRHQDTHSVAKCQNLLDLSDEAASVSVLHAHDQVYVPMGHVRLRLERLILDINRPLPEIDFDLPRFPGFQHG